MGRQSARLWYRGKDHKDIYFQGNYHKAMYFGNTLLWQKLAGNLSVESIRSTAGVAFGSLNNRYVYFIEKTDGIWYVRRIDLNTKSVTQVSRLGDDESYTYDHQFYALNGIGIIVDRISSHGTLDPRDYILSAMINVYDLDAFAPHPNVFNMISAIDGYDFGYAGLRTLLPYNGFRYGNSLKVAGLYKERVNDPYATPKQPVFVGTYSLDDGVVGNIMVKGIKYDGAQEFQPIYWYSNYVPDIGFGSPSLKYSYTKSGEIQNFDLVRIPHDIPDTYLKQNDNAFEYSDRIPLIGNVEGVATRYRESVYKSNLICYRLTNGYINRENISDPLHTAETIIERQTVGNYDMSPNGNLFVYATESVGELIYKYYLYDLALDQTIQLPNAQSYYFAGDYCLGGSNGLYHIKYT